MAGFDTLLGAVTKFGIIAVEIEALKHAALEAAAKKFLEHAKKAIGTYEYGWEPLAESTLRNKKADTPLLETGEMQASGGYEVRTTSAIVGFTDPKIVWHEFGTSHVPPRPVIGGTIDHHGEEIAKLMGVRFAEVMVATLVTGNVISALSRFRR